MNIVVLAGGLSPERNVSLSSGAMVTEALRSKGHRVALADLFLGIDADEEGALFDAPVPAAFKSVAREAPDLALLRKSRPAQGPSAIGPGIIALCQAADVVYLALHGTCGEDGKIQGMLDLLGIPYTGSGSLPSAVAMDKDLTKRLVAGLVNTPRWQSVEVTADNLERLTAETPLPAVVKPADSGSSIGVYIVHDRESLRCTLEETAKTGGRTVIEDYIKGREIQVAVLQDRALPSIEIIPQTEFYDYENKYQPGFAREVCPAEIPAEWEKTVGDAALAVFRALGLSVYSRADFIVTEDGTPYFLEINTLPGMTPTSLVPQEAAVVGIDYANLCEIIVEESIRARREGL